MIHGVKDMPARRGESDTELYVPKEPPALKPRRKPMSPAMVAISIVGGIVLLVLLTLLALFLLVGWQIHSLGHF